jgi:hypothetical protein
MSRMLWIVSNLKTPRIQRTWGIRHQHLAMPSDQRVGFNDGERVPPIKPAGQTGESESDGIVSPAWFDFPLDEQTELFAQKQVFGCDCSRGPETEVNECERVKENSGQVPNEVEQQAHDWILLSH